MTEFSLLELFREEARSHIQAIDAGLVTLEQEPNDLAPIEAMMRAAHSVKGAARAVGIDAIVPLAHALEECLVQAQRRAIVLAGPDIDELLVGVDLLGQAVDQVGGGFDDWATESQSRLAAAVAQLEAIGKGQHFTATGRGDGESVVPPHADSLDHAPSPAPPAAAATQPPHPQVHAGPLLDAFRGELLDNVALARNAMGRAAGGDAALFTVVHDALRSIKGAAKIMNLDSPFMLAEKLQGVIAQLGNRPSTTAGGAPPIVERCLAELESLANAADDDFSDRLEERDPIYRQLLDALGLTTERQPTEQQLAAQPPVAKTVRGSQRSVASAEPRRQRPLDETRPRKSATGEVNERVVRVTAQSLTRLMGLAGESLVEARWLHPFAQSLLKLKKQQSLVAHMLDELRLSLPPDPLQHSIRLTELLGQAVEEGRHLLADRIEAFENHARRSDDLNSRLYHEVIASRMRPFNDGVQTFPRMVRDLARQLGKQVHFEIRGRTTEVDRDILDKLEAPLTHILRNALDHGLELPDERLAAGKSETGSLLLDARHSAGMLDIRIADDGRGIDVEGVRQKIVERRLAPAEMAGRLTKPELLEFLLLPGFSTASEVTEVSGRGVGLDVVHSMVHAVGGTVRINTELSLGTTFLLQLPITLSVIRAVLIEVAGERYALPHNRIDRLVRVSQTALRSLENRVFIEVDGRNVGLVLARQVLELDGEERDDGQLNVVLLSNQNEIYGLVVDAFCGEQDLVVRPLDPRLGKVADVSAAAVLEDGSPILILDVDDLRRSLERLLTGHLERVDRAFDLSGGQRKRRILVVDDSLTVREVQRQMLSAAGYEVETAVDGVDGWNTAREHPFDLVISDIDMPRMNGFDFVRQIRSDPRLESLPVVIVSYKDRAEDRERGLQVGANYYLTKSSFHDETLLDAVRDLLGDLG